MRKLAFLMILALLCLALPFACAEEEISYGELFGDPATPAQLPSAGAQPAQEQMAPTPVPTATPRLEGDGSVLLTITAVGDVTIGRNVQSSSTIFAKELKRQDDDINFIFRNVKDIFAQDDITIVNFEGVLAEDYSIPSKKRNNSFLFLAPTAYAQALPDNGVEIATIENISTILETMAAPALSRRWPTWALPGRTSIIWPSMKRRASRWPCSPTRPLIIMIRSTPRCPPRLRQPRQIMIW